MPAQNQDFETFAGNSVSPIFTVTNNGVVVDISTVTDISWSMQLDAESAALVTKTKSAGQIVFVTNGTDGKFKVNILGADTTGKSGFYVHTATITDGSGNLTTVAIGRMQVAIRPLWSYNPAAISTSPLYQVRMLIGDVIQSEQQMMDEEIRWQITQYPSIWAAAAACARQISAKYARMVDTVQGDVRTMYSSRSRNYMAVAVSLDFQGKGRSGALAYAGGISQADKVNQVEDTDRVSPQFNLMMDDNLLPVGPVGNQTPGSPLPDVSNT
jgi:hypothetical protein